MPRTGPSRLALSETWTYALLGGLASIPLTVGAYWLSGAGSEFSLNAVVVAGLLAGYLARTGSPESDGAAAGFRAGLIGGLPAVAWILWEFLPVAAAGGSPTFFRVLSVVGVAAVGTLALGLGGLVGLLGGKVGGWLAARIGRSRHPAAGN